MIGSFASKETEKIINCEKARLLPHDIIRRALMRLDRIVAVLQIEELRFPPSHHLEKLSGDRVGKMYPIHPGEHLKEFLEETGISQNAFVPYLSACRLCASRMSFTASAR